MGIPCKSRMSIKRIPCVRYRTKIRLPQEEVSRRHTAWGFFVLQFRHSVSCYPVEETVVKCRQYCPGRNVVKRTDISVIARASNNKQQWKNILSDDRDPSERTLMSFQSTTKDSQKKKARISFRQFREAEDFKTTGY